MVQRFGSFVRNHYLCTIICVTIKFEIMENNIQKEDLLALVKSKIYTIRGQKVMLDFDLAQMYNVKTGSLNQSVKRNIERFPDDFMFQLTETEWEEWKSQYVTSNFLENKEVSDLLSQNVTAKSMNKKRFTPYAFTPFGVSMLSSVLRSKIAIQRNIIIMRAFVLFSELMTNPMPDNNSELRAEIKALRDEMNDILADQNDINESTRAQLEAISTALAELQVEHRQQPKRKPIGFIQPKDDDNDETK